MEFKTEKESIDYLVARLERKGWTNINPTQSTNPYAYYDIEAEYKGKRYRIEVKRRRFNTNTYSDHVMECSKLSKFKEDVENGVIAGGFLVSLCYDGMKISNVLEWSFKDIKQAPKTTDFANNNYVDKSFVHYEKCKIVRYD